MNNKWSVVYHQTNNPGALKVKASITLASTILAASTAGQESRLLGTTSGKEHYAPNIRADGFGATRFRLGLLPGAAWTEGCWIRFVRKIHCVLYEATEVSSLLRVTRRRNRPTSRPLIKNTGLEIELTKHTVSSRPRGASPSAALSLV